MGITGSATEPHWNYFLAIERDLGVLSRYVEFDEPNFKCFSLEIARILLATSAEVDVVCKQVCGIANPKSKADSINSYRAELKRYIPSIFDFEVLIPSFRLDAQTLG